MIDNQIPDSHTENPANLLSRRRFFYQSGLAVFTTAFLASCGKMADDVLPETETPEPDKEVVPDRDKTLAFFGDSLTIGAGGTAPYGNMVGAALASRPVVSDGIVGQGAASIAVRQGGTPLKITVEGNKLDSIKPIKITKLSNQFLSTPSRNEEYSRKGTILGVRCTIRRIPSGADGEMYTITPDTVSTIDIPADSEFVLEDAAKLKTATQVLWYGRNNIGKPGAEEEILSSLESSIAYITAPARYVVLGVLTEADENKGSENYNQVIAINEKLAAKYGDKYVKMTPPTDAEMAAISYKPTPEDLTDLENLNFPRGMRADITSDDIHLNDKGYQIVANRVIEKLKALKY
ncbi:SGNH/GDSL hydrolase family protein [Salmonirosea aquatica]|uniref:SGNH/GDSL hydrolase family protein n=1 Tax=Salmonirosea aquatica TaxID=2654236 RepID=UPI0035713EF0